MENIGCCLTVVAHKNRNLGEIVDANKLAEIIKNIPEKNLVIESIFLSINRE